jgi:uncharacterized protein
MSEWLLFLLIGLGGGIVSGMFGVGGGVIIVPALVLLAGFTQHKAIGTSLAVMLPPIGLAAVFEYYRHQNVSIRAALIIAITMFIGGWAGSYVANRMSSDHLRFSFGVFIVAVGLYMAHGASKRLGWI